MTIDWLFHLFALVPHKLRTAKRMAWLTMMLKGLQEIHAEFLLWRDDVNRRATFNGQVMVLERMLNLRYFTDFEGNPLDVWASPPDPTADGHIWIEQVAGVMENGVIWYDSEGQDGDHVWWYDSEGETNPATMWYDSEMTSVISFIVRVPNALAFSAPEMRARIDRYVIAGFNYDIQTYIP